MISRIYTIANYNFINPLELAMVVMSLRSIISNFDGEVIVLSEKPIEKFLSKHINCTSVTFKIEPGLPDSDEFALLRSKLNATNVSSKKLLRYKLHHLCKIDEPFLYLDLDIKVLSNLNNLVQSIQDKPLAAVSDMSHEGNINTFLNSGVLLVNDPEILNWTKILSSSKELPTVAKNNSVGDQALLDFYFKSINYDYRHPKLGIEWNASDRFVSVIKENDKWVATLLNKINVNINHFYHEKPYSVFCPMYQEVFFELFPIMPIRIPMEYKKEYLKLYIKRFLGINTCLGYYTGKKMHYNNYLNFNGLNFNQQHESFL